MLIDHCWKYQEIKTCCSRCILQCCTLKLLLFYSSTACLSMHHFRNKKKIDDGAKSRTDSVAQKSKSAEKYHSYRYLTDSTREPRAWTLVRCVIVDGKVRDVWVGDHSMWRPPKDAETYVTEDRIASFIFWENIRPAWHWLVSKCPSRMLAISIPHG